MSLRNVTSPNSDISQIIAVHTIDFCSHRPIDPNNHEISRLFTYSSGQLRKVCAAVSGPPSRIYFSIP